LISLERKHFFPEEFLKENKKKKEKSEKNKVKA